MPKHNKRQERELLELEIELARLKLAAGELQRRREQQASRQSENIGQELLSLAGNASAKGLAWRAVTLPVSLKHRLLVCAAFLAWEYWRNQSKRYR